MLVRKIWEKNREAAAIKEARRVVVCIDLTEELAGRFNAESAATRRPVPDLIVSALNGVFKTK
jgi:predicted ABC-type ATPase